MNYFLVIHHDHEWARPYLPQHLTNHSLLGYSTNHNPANPQKLTSNHISTNTTKNTIQPKYNKHEAATATQHNPSTAQQTLSSHSATNSNQPQHKNTIQTHNNKH